MVDKISPALCGLKLLLGKFEHCNFVQPNQDAVNVNLTNSRTIKSTEIPKISKLITYLPNYLTFSSFNDAFFTFVDNRSSKI